MREIKAVIQPFMLEPVLAALHQIEGLPGLTVSEVRGFGRGGADRLRSEGTAAEHVHRTRLELVVSDHLVDEVVEAIRKAAHTGRKGDGKIFVLPVLDAVQIRTGDRGEEAL